MTAPREPHASPVPIQALDDNFNDLCSHVPRNHASGVTVVESPLVDR